MNPLLFADWGRMNRLFTRVMWVIAVVLVCVVGVLASAPGSHSQATAPRAGSAPAVAAGPAGAR